MLSQLKQALPPSVKRPLRSMLGMDLLLARIAELEVALAQASDRERTLNGECGVLREDAVALREQCESLRASADALREECRSLRADSHALLAKMHPGREDSGVLLPLDYAPSRNLTPRWGFSRPPIPAIEALYSRHFDRYREVLAGIMDLGDYLRAIPQEFEHAQIPTPGWSDICLTPLDAAALYYFVSKYRPRTYLEIGSGSTTCFAHRAAKDHATGTRIISIDPEPRAAIDRACDEVIRAPLETAPLDLFAALEPGDIAFLDGSHRSFMNSDVTVFMIDILPMLKRGVLVHIHDITLPIDYPDSYKHWYWNEQYLLAVYLMGNAERVIPLFPSTYVAAQQDLMAGFEPPVTTIERRRWNFGGSSWFTHC